MSHHPLPFEFAAMLQNVETISIISDNALASDGNKRRLTTTASSSRLAHKDRWHTCGSSSPRPPRLPTSPRSSVSKKVNTLRTSHCFSGMTVPEVTLYNSALPIKMPLRKHSSPPKDQASGFARRRLVDPRSLDALEQSLKLSIEIFELVAISPAGK